MKSLSKAKRNRLFLVAILTLALMVGIWQGLIAAQKRSLESLGKQVSEQKIKLDNAQRLVSSAAQLQHNLETARQKLTALESGMASGDMYSWIIQTVNRFKEGYRLDIPQFSRESPTEIGMFPKFPYKAVQFSLRGTAYFHDFGKFLADFENRFPYLRVQNLELEPAATTSANNTEDAEKLSFRLEIVTLVNPHVH
jgi:Tfp pilus assembly protein PilO